MTLLGLTGGVGMGKSACTQFLRERAIPVVDTDDLARAVVEPGQPALTEIQRAFGPEIIGPDGRLRRDLLARRVFADPHSRHQLEAILHPRIRALWQAQVHQWRNEHRPKAAVAIPLLFETSAESEFDAVICVACSRATQMERLKARGWSAEQIHQRIRAQLPTEDKIASSNYVIWTEGSLEIHAAQLDRILEWRSDGVRE
jgi:dephospho-CoA kinase